MKRQFGFLAASAAIFFALSANANAGLVITADALYLERAEMHPYVGYVETIDPVEGTNFVGSGNLIAPNWVLMSAHQALKINNDQSTAYSGFNFGLGSNYLTNRGEIMTATDLYIHPSHNNSYDGWDLALLYFDNPFASATPISLFEGEVVAGMEADIVGYGKYQMLNEEESVHTGDRRAGTNFIYKDVTSYAHGVTTYLARGSVTPLGMAGRPGDSGGGLIIGGELGGIVDNATTGSGLFEITGYTVIDNDWVNATMASRASAVPEPSSLILLLTMTTAIAFARKRKPS